MKKALIMGAVLCLVLFALGAFLLGAPTFEMGAIEAAQTLDYRIVDQAAPAIAGTAADALVFLSALQVKNLGQHSTTIANYMKRRNAITVIPWPATINRHSARGFDRVKFI